MRSEPQTSEGPARWTMVQANLVEIFSSFQGEGPHLGCSTIFVRFGACDLRCRWCDSPHTWKAGPRCRIEDPAHGERELANPVALADAVAAVEALDLPRHRFVSLTGGEPLLQPDAVRSVAQALRGRGPRLFLETHGLATDALARVRDAIDVVSMDWKLASEVERADAPRGAAREQFHAQHAAFLRTALASCETYVKVVVTPSTRDDELDALAQHVAAIDPGVLVVVQPVTPRGGVRERPTAAQLLAWQMRLERTLRDVRVIPQTHPALDVR
jgi:organic radical activating enzyme